MTTSPLHPSHGTDSWVHVAARLASIARRLANTPELWCDRVEHEAGARRYARVPIGIAEAWVITWAPGTGLALHDHGEAAGAVSVVSGSLVERYGIRQVPRQLRTRVLEPGAVLTFDEDHVHEVVNEGTVPAVSLHVYSAPLDRMTFFADDPRDDVVLAARGAKL